VAAGAAWAGAGLDWATVFYWGLTGASSSEDSSSDEDSCFFTGFLATTAGFLGASSEDSSSDEDSCFLTGFFATTGAFLTGTSSELSSELSYFLTYF
jgi:hypothetical protein